MPRLYKMKSTYLNLLFVFSFCVFITGCNPQSKDLEVKLNQEYLCIFTNNPKTHYGYDNSIVVSTGEIDHTRQFKSNYEQLYKNGVLPINEKSCIQISVDIFEKILYMKSLWKQIKFITEKFVCSRVMVG